MEKSIKYVRESLVNKEVSYDSLSERYIVALSAVKLESDAVEGVATGFKYMKEKLKDARDSYNKMKGKTGCETDLRICLQSFGAFDDAYKTISSGLYRLEVLAGIRRE